LHTPTTLESRIARYSKVLSEKTLTRTHALVIGVGSVGRPLALQLASMGVEYLTIFDPDTVASTNLGSQGYPERWCVGNNYESCIGELKINVLVPALEDLNPLIDLRVFAQPFTPETPTHRITESNLVPDPTVAFLCVDAMSTRLECAKAILNAWPSCTLIDCRVAAETGRIVMVPPFVRTPDGAVSGQSLDRLEFYERRWFPDSEGLTLPCGYQATLFSSTLAASIAISRWTLVDRYLDATPPIEITADDCDWVYDLLCMTLQPNPLPEGEETDDQEELEHLHAVV